MPLEVLEDVKANLVNWHGCGMSVMEMSHRGKEFTGIMNELDKNFRDILNVPDNYKVVWNQGGATLQFAGIPLNMLGGSSNKTDYIVTGQWSEKAHKEAAKYCDKNLNQLVYNSKDNKFTTTPTQSELKLDS